LPLPRPLLSNDLARKDERNSRINVVRRGIFSMGRLWSSKARVSTKRLVFITKVWSAATSAIEAFTWSKRDMKQIEAVLWKLGKKLLPRRGKQITTGDDGKETFKAMKNAEARRKLRLLTLVTERDVKQLKWMQRMLKDPENQGHNGGRQDRRQSESVGQDV
jgi:hypothetical protein